MFMNPLRVDFRRFSSFTLIGCLIFSSLTAWGDPAPGVPIPASPAVETTAPAAEPAITDPAIDGEASPDLNEDITPVTDPTAPAMPAPAVPTLPQPPAVTPAVPLNTDGYPLVESFAPTLPDTFTLNLQYNKYLTNYDYALPKNGVGIRTGPGGNFELIRTPGTYEKMSLVDSVKGEYIDKYKSDLWYRIYWYDKTGIRTGYVYGPLISVRHYDLARKLQEAKAVQADLSKAGTLGFVNNYKNRKGIPPSLAGGAKDIFGNESSQSAPGYTTLKNLKEFIYVQDGTLLLILGQSAGYYQCRLPGKTTTYWIPMKYITATASMKKTDRFIVVDRKQQNAAVFQMTATGWQLLSYQVVTTGANDQYRFPTPLGTFMAIEKKTKFIYLHDITKAVDGYAPHAIRFSGGAYLHGVPVPYKKDPATGQLVDPGETETLSTLGTVPRSHKCIRNYTSHAKFMYDWAVIGQTAVIVIE